MGVKVSQPNEDRILLESKHKLRRHSDGSGRTRRARVFELIWGSTLPEAFPNALDAVP